MNYPDGHSSWKCVNPVIVCCNLTGWALLEYILFCHLLWWVFYYFLLLTTKQSEEWCCRFLTFFHGCLISYSALMDAYVNKSPIGFQNLPLSETTKKYLSWMLSYFLFDFSWIHFVGNETWIIYCHHIASILIITNVLLRNYGGAGVAYGAAGLELTNPYLQLRWFLRSHGYQNRRIHKITEVWFFLLFFVIRMIGGTMVVYQTVFHSDTDLAMKASCISIYGISLILQWQILVYLRKKYWTAESMAHIYSISSRVSISLYFERRTVDLYEHQNREHRAIQDGKVIKESSPPATEEPPPVTEPSKSPTSQPEERKESVEGGSNANADPDAEAESLNKEENSE